LSQCDTHGELTAGVGVRSLRVSFAALALIAAGYAVVRAVVILAYLMAWLTVLLRKPQHLDKVNRLGEIVCRPWSVPSVPGRTPRLEPPREGC